MIIPNTCIGASARLSSSPVPVTIVKDEGGEVDAVCPFRVKGLCLEVAADKLETAKKEVIDHPRGEEAQRHQSCLYSREGRTIA